MNVDKEFFNEVALESKRVDEVLSAFLSDTNSIISKGFRNRLINNIINTEFYKLKNIILDSRYSSSDLETQAKYAYDIWSRDPSEDFYIKFDNKDSKISPFNFDKQDRTIIVYDNYYPYLGDLPQLENGIGKGIMLTGEFLKTFLYYFKEEMDNPNYERNIHINNCISDEFFNEGGEYNYLTLDFDYLLLYAKETRERLLLNELNNDSFMDLSNIDEVEKNDESFKLLEYILTIFKENIDYENSLSDPNSIINTTTISVGSISDASLSKVIDFSIQDLINIINDDFSYKQFEKNLIVDSNVYLHAFDVLYNMIKNGEINLRLSDDNFLRLKKLSYKYNVDLLKIDSKSQIIANVFTEDYNSAKTYKYDNIEIRVSNTWNKESNTISLFEDSIDNMPDILKSNIKSIFFSNETSPANPFWQFVFSSPNLAGMASASVEGDITVFPSMNDWPEDVQCTLNHEAAHLLDNKISISSSEEWKIATDKDIKYPSSYAASNQSENWAESIAYYYRDPNKFKIEFPNRTSIIESALSISNKTIIIESALETPDSN